MKFILKPALLLLFPLVSSAQEQYHYQVDLKNVKKDRVAIECQTPEIKENEAVFSIPKAIPGSYQEKNFGRFVHDFSAFSKDGKKLKVEKININQFKITDARNLVRISYKVSDTWDEKHPDFIFQPGGTNIDAGKNFAINNHAFFGYFEGYKSLPFRITVSKPASMFGATNLPVERKSPEEDVLTAKNYVYLADNPILYAQPDTTSFNIGETKINVAVYSETGKVKSQQIAGMLKPMGAALEKFFTVLPVESYQFLYYFADPKTALTNREKGEGGYGALEHNYSSFYYLPEMTLEKQLKSLVTEVSGHEFLHILTPLNLHSEEIENFDFISPKMSQHLWLYEGVTDYFANLVQFQNGLLTEKEFFNNMREKINQAEEFGDFSMTLMSKNVLSKEYKDKYRSVYNRGALIALMLDLFIREKTEGQKDLKTVITALSKKYGPSKPFNDNELFDELIKASHPEVESFIAKYISGANPLPYEETFKKLGYEYAGLKRLEVFYGGPLGLKFVDEKKQFQFDRVRENAFGIKSGDVFVKVDSKAVTPDNIDEIWEEYFLENSRYPEMVITVERNGQQTELSGRMRYVSKEIKNYLRPLRAKTEGPQALLKQLAAGK